MPSVADAPRPTLCETGPIYVTQAAAQQFLEIRGYKEHELETARRELTELLLDARQQRSMPHMWRARKRSTKLDITAIVKQEGRLLVVTFISVQPYDPPSRTSGNRERERSRFPDGPQHGRASARPTASPVVRRGTRGGRGGARSA
jgi:hypothetical protein